VPPTTTTTTTVPPTTTTTTTTTVPPTTTTTTTTTVPPTTTTTTTVPPTVEPLSLFFSTLGGGNRNPVPGVGRPYDDADVYLWDNTNFSRDLDGSVEGLPGNADIDGLAIDGSNYYISFNRNGGVNLPSSGGGSFTVQDEDVVLFNSATSVWTMFFRGASCGLDASNGGDISALDVVNNSLYFSTIGNSSVAGVSAPYDDADIYKWDGSGCGRVFDGSANGLPGSADIDGLAIDGSTFYMSFIATDTAVSGFGTVQDEDVVMYDAGTWSLFFDGTGLGLDSTSGQDLDAIDVQ